jgi:hypothetical protein
LSDTVEPNPVVWQLLAHETAHYYFGTLFSTAGKYQPFYTESFAEYLSLKLVEHVFGKVVFKKKLEQYCREITKMNDVTSFKEASKKQLGEDVYRYRYGPLLLAAIEQEIGAENMKRVLKMLLQTPAVRQKTADYNFLRSTVLTVGVTNEQWEQFERKYVLPGPAKSQLGAMLVKLK